MASINKNITTIIAQGINGPKIDGIPLYSRIDGSQESGFSAQTNKSEKWEIASKNTFTSPTNIRKVFITGNKIVVNLYKPAIIKGKPDTQGCWREFALTGDNNLRECAMKQLNYSQDSSRHFMEKQVNPKAEAPDKVTLKGSGLGSISRPWVLSNIEEVYFDYSILASETHRNSGLGCEELLRAYFEGKRGYIQSDIILEMFLRANSADKISLRNRFPRLKCVGLISELSTILSVAHDKGKPGLDSIEDSIILWSKRETNIALIKQSNSLMSMAELKEDIQIYNTNFAIRDGIYRFDRDVLKDYFSDYERRVKDFIRAEKNKGAVQIQPEEIETGTRAEKSELEKLLDNIAETRCIADAKSVLILSLAGATISEVNDIFGNMSSEGVAKYKALLNLRELKNSLN